MSPRNYQLVKTNHLTMVKEARAELAKEPRNAVLRRKLAKELWPLRALRNHHDLNQYL